MQTRNERIVNRNSTEIIWVPEQYNIAWDDKADELDSERSSLASVKLKNPKLLQTLMAELA